MSAQKASGIEAGLSDKQGIFLEGRVVFGNKAA
jgi:hypothetical protein